jgi:hypothetical protein
MRRAKEGDTRALIDRDRRQRLDEIHDRECSERSDRGGGRGHGRGRRGGGGIGNDDRPRDNGWSGRGVGVSDLSLAFFYRKLLTIFSVRDIALPPFWLVYSWQDALQRSLISFRRPFASLPLPQPHPRAFRVVHFHAAGLFPLEVPPRHHHHGGGGARPLSHHESTSGTAGVEGATATAHRHAKSHLHRGGAFPVEAPTTLVADAVQAHIAPEKDAHCPASGRRLLRVGNGASGIGVRTGVGIRAGVRRTGGVPRKGRPEGAGAGAGAGAARVRVRVDAMTKVRAKDVISAPQTVLRLK